MAPGGHRFNLVLQQRVFHSLPISDGKLATKLDTARQHLDRCARHSAVPIPRASFYEFGAGWDLALPLALFLLGVERQTVVDRDRLATDHLISGVAARLTTLVNTSHRRLPDADVPVAELLPSAGITYVAPCDAAATPLADGSVDCITSTNTLEHIPPRDLRRILAECKRILAPGGCMSVRVDYQDHYSYFDAERSPYGFLAHDERSWDRWNPSLHYQNRLRHHEYVSLFEEAGFEVVEDQPWGGTPEDIEELSTISLAEPFASMDPRAAALRGAWIVLRHARITPAGSA
jgi:SAM-dependent methyltransferase